MLFNDNNNKIRLLNYNLLIFRTTTMNLLHPDHVHVEPELYPTGHHIASSVCEGRYCNYPLSTTSLYHAMSADKWRHPKRLTSHSFQPKPVMLLYWNLKSLPITFLAQPLYQHVDIYKENKIFSCTKISPVRKCQGIFVFHAWYCRN